MSSKSELKNNPRGKNALTLSALFLGVSLFGGTCFLMIAHAVSAGRLRQFDEYFLLFFRNSADTARGIGPAWLQETLVEITSLGGYPIVILTLIAVVSLLLLTRRIALALYTFFSVGLGWLLSHFLKQLYDRPRPDLVPYLDKIHTASFPSGHAMMSTVIYLTLATLVIRCFEDMRVRAYAVCLAIFLAGIIGISRVYLGVHWPSDVLAGWALGAAWVSFTWLVAIGIQATRHRK